jgi:hypothetical protein
MKIKNMEILPLGFYTILLCLVFNINAEAQTTNFTGDWKVNLEKSDFGSWPKTHAASQFKMIQGQNVITIERIINFKDSTTKSTEKLIVDGSPTVTKFPDRTKEANIKWSPEKTSLIEIAVQKFTNVDGTKGQYQSVEIFNLSKDKRELLYERRVISEKVNFIIRAIYSKTN